MTHDLTPKHNRDEPSQRYSDYVLLENLESLLEELEEEGVSGDLAEADLPQGLIERAQEAQVTSIQELRAKIAHLHSEFDTSEDE